MGSIKAGLYESEIRLIMSSFLHVSLYLFLTIISQVEGKPKHFLVETADSPTQGSPVNDYGNEGDKELLKQGMKYDAKTKSYYELGEPPSINPESNEYAASNDYNKANSNNDYGAEEDKELLKQGYKYDAKTKSYYQVGEPLFFTTE